MDDLHTLILELSAPLWNVLVWVLIAVGLFFTLSTGFVQLRLFKRSIATLRQSRQTQGDSHGITPFQAFVTGLASRVGVGNVAGVAIAITAGGPGAVFWMWLTAFLGMSSAFAESSLAQLFKVRDAQNKQFRGGPAYYIAQGLKQKWLAVLFSLSLILAYGFVFNAVQANSIVSATQLAWGWSNADIRINDGLRISWIGIAVAAATGVTIFGGIRRVARLAEIIVPFMAALYLFVALYIAIINIDQLPALFALIIDDAFSLKAAGGGLLGGLISQAMMLGIKRGLFSNEAGMGSAPNAAAASNVKHPIDQGMIQMLGVFVDTFIVCSCTAIVILSALPELSGIEEGVQLTQASLQHHVGSWAAGFLAFLLFLFCFSSIIGNYAYAESNVQFINSNPRLMLVFRLLVIAMVYFGAIANVPLVWDMADLSMGLMAIINLAAIVLLAPIVWLLLRDYTGQLKHTTEPVFRISAHPRLSKQVESDIWE